ncbi:hypothetical protein NQ317_007479 [Molorchus minor]|uniref:Angiotensin-converting enzyme n=1 Tax=Molorchus minor TaxID=1323400 RepID=A0ABQ9K3T7_9CUCU|nr:hypothetical protein NQ317_007479 [Molorchus minor]
MATSFMDGTRICPYKKQNCNLQEEGVAPDKVMGKSVDYDELVYVWTAFRDATGPKIKKTYIDLSNESARLNNFTDRGAQWRSLYEDDNFIDNMEKLWRQVRPLYIELHKYVGRKLKMRYRSKLDISDGLIPDNVFGEAQPIFWTNISDIARPFPSASKLDLDVDAALIKQGYTPLRMFQTVDKFFQSLGLLPMAVAYNESAGAVIQEPADKSIFCGGGGSAWTFCDKKNIQFSNCFRIKMCTKVTYEDLIIAHHEMGHIQYFMQMEDQPFMFREPPNRAFNEAIGDLITLSVATPNHLPGINLLNDYIESAEADINNLMDMALLKVSFMPFGLLGDKWRWDAFRGSVTEDKWNTHWWEYKRSYQSIKSRLRDQMKEILILVLCLPLSSMNKISRKYYLSRVLQFQFYKGLCIATGQYDPANKVVSLHKCNFYNSTLVGNRIRDAMRLGRSEHWSVPFEILTGNKTISAEPLLEYFEPLHTFLKGENGEYERFLSELIDPRIEVPNVSGLLFSFDEIKEEDFRRSR